MTSSALEQQTDTPLVIGVSILDFSMVMLENLPIKLDGAMYHTDSAITAGGVGRNLAESIYKLYGKVNFVSLIGDDAIGETLLKLMPKFICKHIEKTTDHRTSSCTVVFDSKGDCKLILGDMEIHKNFYAQYIQRHLDLFTMAPLIVIDANLPLDTMKFILANAIKYEVPAFYEPTDLRIAGNPLRQIPANLFKQVRFITPNLAELKHITQAVYPKLKIPQQEDSTSKEELVEITKALLLTIANRFDCIVVTLGKHGVVLCLSSQVNPFEDGLFKHNKYIVGQCIATDCVRRNIMYFPVPFIIEQIVNVSGAGDSFSGGFISGLLKELTVFEAIILGFLAAQEALQTAGAVPKDYFPNLKGMSIEGATQFIEYKEYVKQNCINLME